MSTFKVHYAGLGKNRATNRHSASTQESDKTNSIQTPNLVSNESPTGSFFKNAKSQNDLFAGFHSENMDYINLLISKTPKNKKEVQKKQKISRDQKEKKENKEISKNPASQAESPFTSRKPVEVIAPVPKPVEMEKPPSAMLPDNDDGMLLKLMSCQKKASDCSKNDQSENQFYEGIDTQISPDLTPTLRKQEDIARRVYKDDAANRRSMSLEDIRFDRKDLLANHNRSTSHYPNKMEKIENNMMEQTDRSPNVSAQQGSRQSLTSPKGNFLASLDGYIDYFKKSGDISYRSMKAGQYLNGSNTGKSYRSLQRELDAAYSEIEIMKAELDKRKRKINELVNGTKMLQKTLQVTSAREEEQQQLLHKLQGQMAHLTQKNTSYKLKYHQLKELFRQERIQNESSLLSLKQVLSKNIKVALEHKSTPYLNTPKERHSQMGSFFAENARILKKDHEKISKQSKKHAEDSDIYASLYAPESLRKLRKPVNVSKQQKESVLISEKASCSSPGGELLEEEEYMNPASSRFEPSYEGEDHFQEPYGQNLAKDCQIQFLKHKLAELTNNEDVSFSALTPSGKSTDKATNRSRQSLHKKKTSAVILPSYYMSRHADNQPYLAVNYRPQDQTSRARNYGSNECSSPNYGSERSFSLHSNE